MKKFEYKVISKICPPSENIDSLRASYDKEQQDGWNLVEMNKDDYPSCQKNSAGECYLLVFKREVR